MAVLETCEDFICAVKTVSGFKQYISKSGAKAKHNRNLLLWGEMKYRDKSTTVNKIAERYDISPMRVYEIFKKIESQFNEYNKLQQVLNCE